MYMEGKIIPKHKAAISKDRFSRNNERKENWQPGDRQKNKIEMKYRHRHITYSRYT